MNFPWTRHAQRYEYIVRNGYIEDKTVVDLGCGIPMGTYALSAVAKRVYGVDLELDLLGKVPVWTFNAARPDRVFLIKDNLFVFQHKVDVCVAVEVFEHMFSPGELIEHMASIGEYAFITTPLAKVTGKTRNAEHIAEYSAKDFEQIVTNRFDIVDRRYQLGDLQIVNKASPNGDSIDLGHVVQMLWCKRNGR